MKIPWDINTVARHVVNAHRLEVSTFCPRRTNYWRGDSQNEMAKMTPKNHLALSCIQHTQSDSQTNTTVDIADTIKKKLQAPR